MNTPTQTSSRDLMASIRRVFSSRDSHMTLILILAIVVATILVPRFSQPRTLTFLTLDVTATLLMALPMTLVMINADIDLSVASTAGLVSASFGVLVQSGVGFWASVAICLLIGLACGLVNVVFGGVSVFGGRGSIWGSVCGVLTIGVLNYALRLNRIPEVILVLVTGLLLIGSVVAPSLVDAIRQRLAHRADARTPRASIAPGAASA